MRSELIMDEMELIVLDPGKAFTQVKPGRGIGGQRGQRTKPLVIGTFWTVLARLGLWAQCNSILNRVRAEGRDLVLLAERGLALLKVR